MLRRRHLCRSNLGSISNKGIEISLGSRVYESRDFYLDANFNIAFNRSEVLDIPGEAMYFEATNVISGAGNFVVVQKGQPLGQWYGYKVDGVFHSQEEIDALPDDYAIFSVKKDQLRPGDHRFQPHQGQDHRDRGREGGEGKDHR